MTETLQKEIANKAIERNRARGLRSIRRNHDGVMFEGKSRRCQTCSESQKEADDGTENQFLKQPRKIK